MCGVSGLPIAEPRDEDFAEALLALSGLPDEPMDVETTFQVDPNQQVDDRFYCPFPGCRRSFAELWRLKVHYRAPPNVRGSGKERGHGMRLDRCPKCNAILKIGGHHVRCSAREAARQLAKKPRRTGLAAASELKAGATQQQQQQQQLQQQAEEAGSDSVLDSGYTSTATPGPYMPASLPYAHLDQQQQHASSYSCWQQQQPQQLLQEQPLLQAPMLPEVQQLRRLQQLLTRVDQHLGCDFDLAEPAAANAAMIDHAAAHASAAAVSGDAAGFSSDTAAAGADASHQGSAYHRQLLATISGAAAAAAGCGGVLAAATADEGSSLPSYPLTVQQLQQQQQLFGGSRGFCAAQFGMAQGVVEMRQLAASSDSSTSSYGVGGNGNSGGSSSSSLDGSRVSSIAADMHCEYAASGQQQQYEQQQAQSHLLQLLLQHVRSHQRAFGLVAAKQSTQLQHTADPHGVLQVVAALPPAAAATDEQPGAVQTLLQQALHALAASPAPRHPMHAPEHTLLPAVPVPVAAAAVAPKPASRAPAADSAPEEDPAAAAAAAVAAAAVAAVQATLVQRPSQDESHLLALLRETLA